MDEPLDEGARTHLAKLRLPAEFDQYSLIASPLARAAETASIITGRSPVITEELVEMDWGRWEGCRGVDLLDEPNSGYRHIEEWGWDFQPPGGETPRQVWQRVEPWLTSLEGSAVVISHIGVMRVVLARATGWNFQGQPPFRIKRDRLYRIDKDDNGMLSFDNQPIRLIEA